MSMPAAVRKEKLPGLLIEDWLSRAFLGILEFKCPGKRLTFLLFVDCRAWMVCQTISLAKVLGDIYHTLLTGTKAESPSRAEPYYNVGTYGILVLEERPMSFPVPIFLIV